MTDESLLRLAKEISQDTEGGLSEEAVKWFNGNRGKKVKIVGTGIVGIVKELNPRNRGLYNNERYPIHVEITKHPRSDGIGCVFEYSLDQLEVIEEG